MNITNSPLKNHIKKVYNTNIGTVYLFQDYIVAEYKSGVDITFDNHYEVSMIIETHFKDKPFGFITNRINSYSIDLKDAEYFNKAFPQCKAYAIVSYDKRLHAIIKIEDQFFYFNRRRFDDLLEAVNWVENTLSVT